MHAASQQPAYHHYTTDIHNIQQILMAPPALVFALDLSLAKFASFDL
jgi:hypothetical protein